MIALLIDAAGYIYARHHSITSDELIARGINHVMVYELPNEIVNQRADQRVKVVSSDPLVLELEDIPAPPEPTKTPEQIRIEQLESDNLTLMEAIADLYEMVLSGVDPA